MEQLCIVGFPKCGSVSLMESIPNATRYEYAYMPDGLEKFLKEQVDRKPVFILRDPVERIFSAYRYFNCYKEMSLEEFLKPKPVYDHRLGIDDPIKQADYWEYIKPWLYLNPYIIKLETLKKSQNFPWKNSGDKYRPMNDEERELITKKLEESNLIEKYNNIKESWFKPL